MFNIFYLWYLDPIKTLEVSVISMHVKKVNITKNKINTSITSYEDTYSSLICSACSHADKAIYLNVHSNANSSVLLNLSSPSDYPRNVKFM